MNVTHQIHTRVEDAGSLGIIGVNGRSGNEKRDVQPPCGCSEDWKAHRPDDAYAGGGLLRFEHSSKPQHDPALANWAYNQLRSGGSQS
ncbi:hypothetical protein [Paraburkholderia solisilvae]|uniref:Uncharacterized protein n=1 Tax=Paraburkholderia solisilvae TaxID=624376 RepID=A0A6J5DUD5_9BURK|nr:hypothetical protein [Paraburkholderia solisilvae]CAB3757870.1 hypothetical protein LMG29739_02808 [Paraburkholderia solisilvae]